MAYYKIDEMTELSVDHYPVDGVELRLKSYNVDGETIFDKGGRYIADSTAEAIATLLNRYFDDWQLAYDLTELRTPYRFPEEE